VENGAEQSELLTWDGLAPEARTAWSRKLEQIGLPPLLAEVAGRNVSLEAFDPRALADKVSRDPVLAGKLLAVANSAKYGLITPVTSIQRAVVHLGFNLVKTILLAYEMEGAFGKFNAIGQAHLEYVRRWSAGASVFAHAWAQAAQLPDASTAGTLALLSRLGVLVLGLGQPAPGEAYYEIPGELERVQYEQRYWQAGNHILASELARRWALPVPLPELLARQAEPLQRELSPGPQQTLLALIAASVAIIRAELAGTAESALAVLDNAENELLKTNLANAKLLNCLGELWGGVKLQRELAAATAQ
jgi:HD-like signal output (HDOD) protein